VPRCLLHVHFVLLLQASHVFLSSQNTSSIQEKRIMGTCLVVLNTGREPGDPMNSVAAPGRLCTYDASHLAQEYTYSRFGWCRTCGFAGNIQARDRNARVFYLDTQTPVLITFSLDTCRQPLRNGNGCHDPPMQFSVVNVFGRSTLAGAASNFCCESYQVFAHLYGCIEVSVLLLSRCVAHPSLEPRNICDGPVRRKLLFEMAL
jgi:hypothetical protein